MIAFCLLWEFLKTGDLSSVLISSLLCDTQWQLGNELSRHLQANGEAGIFFFSTDFIFILYKGKPSKMYMFIQLHNIRNIRIVLGRSSVFVPVEHISVVPALCA